MLLNYVFVPKSTNFLLTKCSWNIFVTIKFISFSKMLPRSNVDKHFLIKCCWTSFLSEKSVWNSVSPVTTNEQKMKLLSQFIFPHENTNKQLINLLIRRNKFYGLNWKKQIKHSLLRRQSKKYQWSIFYCQ